MKCRNCGAELKNNTRFCNNCGTPLERSFTYDKSNEYPTLSKNNMPKIIDLSQTKKNTKSKYVILISILLVFLIGLSIFVYMFITNQQKEQKFTSGLELGTKYLSELKYDDAIIEFTKAIEIKPKEPKTYISLADIYVVKEDYDKGIEVLNQGLEQTQSQQIQEKIQETISQKEKFKKEKLQAEVIKAYKKKIEEDYQSLDNKYKYYALCDIDDDGIKELLCDNHINEATANITFYKYIENNLYSLGSLGSGHSKFYKSNGYIIQAYGHMDGEVIYKLHIENNKIKQEKTSEKYPVSQYQKFDNPITFYSLNDTSGIQ